MTLTELTQVIAQEREAAYAVCAEKGDTDPQCRAAWDAVEELQAEAAHQKQGNPEKNSLEKFCDANPDAVECRVYDD